MTETDLLDGILVRRAKNLTDLERIYELRYRGYAKYFTDLAQVQEPLDLSPGAVLLLATDMEDKALGTIRILDRRYGLVELDSFISVDQLLPPGRHPVAEATRFSVPTCIASKWAKLALWKAYFCYCRDTSLQTMLISIRKSAERDYKRLLFEKTGSAGKFLHPKLGSLLHETWILDVQTSKSRHKECNHPLYNLFHEDEHPNIRYD